MALVGNISGSGGVSNTIGITGSLIVANPGLGLFPGLPGSDVAFFVSGNIAPRSPGSPAASPDYAVRGTTVFGGDVVVSGTLFGGSPLYIGDQVIARNGLVVTGTVSMVNGLSGSLTKLADGSSYLVAGTNVTIVSNSNGSVTISSTAAGGGGGGSNFFTETSLGVIYNSGTVAFTGARTGESIDAASDKGTDVVFYFSGSTAGDATTLFGGDVVTSGSITVRDAASNLAITGDGFGYSYITAAGSYLNLDANNRVIVKKDLEVQGTNIFAGGSGAARGIYTDNVTQANLITIGGVGGKTTVAGELEVTSNFISGSVGVNLTLGSGGDVTVAGDLTVTGNDIKSSTGATAITLSAGNVIIPGDLTVNGTTTTVNTDNLVVKDQLIYIASSSAAGTVTYGGLAIASGSGTTNQALVFVKDGTGTTSLWSAGRQDVNSGSATTNSGLTYMPVRASSFEMGGTPGSAVAAGSAYLSSSDALNVLVNHTATTTFTKAGAAIVQITDKSGAGMITGNSAVGTIATLWVSGSSINLGHTKASAAGNVPNSIKIWGDTTQGGFIRASGAGPATLSIVGSEEAGTPSLLVLSGANVTINASTSNATNGVVIAGGSSATTLSRFHGNSTSVNLDLAGTSNNTISGLAGSTTELTLTGSILNLSHGSAPTSLITLQRNGSKYGTIAYVSDGGTNYAQFASDNTIGTNPAVRIGSLQKVSLSGSVLEVAAGSGAIFQTTTNGATGYLQAQSGSFTLGSNTFANAAKIVSINSNPLLLGSPGFVFITGSAARISVTGTAAVGLQRDGTSFVTFSSGSTTRNDVTVATNLSTELNLFETAATTVNAFGAATTLNFATGSTTTGTYNLVTGLAASGQTKTINIGTGGLASSTTNIVLGSTLGGGTITANENLVPGSPNAYDLGAVDNRWRNIYTGDLHLKNDRGNWTIVEEAEFLSITNNLSGKRYKFVLEEI